MARPRSLSALGCQPGASPLRACGSLVPQGRRPRECCVSGDIPSLGPSAIKNFLLGFPHLGLSKTPLRCSRPCNRDLATDGGIHGHHHAFLATKNNPGKITSREGEVKLGGSGLGSRGLGDSHQRVPACLRNLAGCSRWVMAVIQSHGLAAVQGPGRERPEGLFSNCTFAHTLIKLWRQPTARPSPQISARTVPWYLFMSNTCGRVHTQADSRSMPRRYSVPQHDSF